MMKLSISSQCYDRAISIGKMDLFELTRISREKLRLDGIEIEDKHFESTDADCLRRLDAEINKNNLEITNIAFFNNYGVEKKEDLDKEFNNFKKWLKVSKMLNLKLMRIFSGWPENQDPELWRQMIDYLKRSCEMAKKEEVLLMMENHNHDGFAKNAESVLKIFEQVGSDNLKLLLDTGNYTDGIASIQKTIIWAVHVHAKFNELNEEGNEKNIDYDTIFKILKENSYSGYISVEYEGEEDEFTAVPRAVNRIRKYVKS